MCLGEYWELSDEDIRRCLDEARAEVGLPPLQRRRTGARYVDDGMVRPMIPVPTTPEDITP